VHKVMVPLERHIMAWSASALRPRQEHWHRRPGSRWRNRQAQSGADRWRLNGHSASAAAMSATHQAK
jgi:hypothetical protein